MLRKTGKYFKGYVLFAVLTPILMILEVVVDVIIPSLMRSTINGGVLAGNVNLVYRNGLYMIIAAIFAFLVGGISTYFGARAGQGLGKNLRLAVFNRVQTFSFANLDKFEVSSLITRLTNDIEIVSDIARMSLRISVRAPFLFIMATIMAVRINTQLSLIFIVALPLMAFGVFLTLKFGLPRFRKYQTKIDSINRRTQENLTAIRVVKAFVREDFEIEKFETQNKKLVRSALNAMNLMILIMPFMMLIMYAVIVAVLWFGGNFMLQGGMQAGDLFSYIMYVGQILMAVMHVAMIMMNFSRARASVERIFEVLETEPEFLESVDQGLTEVPNGSIKFKNVSFKYPGNQHFSLKNINLEIDSGSTLAVIGSTGSSKSTLVHLIPRLYDATEGEVEVGGIPIKDYNLKTLRDQVAIVLQENTLFSGTIRSNMQWGNKDATDQEMIKALEISQAADFVLNRAEGLDARVERGGTNFSGGQKQRLSIARTLLKEPKIIIFDDSTSAVDMTTEARIRAGLDQHNPKLTKIVIAQRISSIQNADKIVVMDDGNICGAGTHEELLEDNKIYQEIYESQQKGMVAG
ncbi:MAG: ABC transporter ATP-binding protein [Clostridiaceae bacterium]|jgi:ATP-binding cassette subfamily B protein|nr:ABC transporter ATP-binding protein [Bacillota bacterium]NLN51857.1 ABC transporter ATP-binding protein [Clostridiaceae bacterium]